MEGKLEDKEINGAHLLQLEELKSSPVVQTPFHRLGTGPNPASLKLGDSGQMLESSRPMMVSVRPPRGTTTRGRRRPCRPHDGGRRS